MACFHLASVTCDECRGLRSMMSVPVDGLAVVYEELRMWKGEAERLRKLFDDAGEGQYNVLALIDHYQDSAIKAQEHARAEFDRGRTVGREDVGKYSNAIGQIEAALGIAGARPLRETVEAVRELVIRADTDNKAKSAWESLYNERNRLWRDAADRIDKVRALLSENGCDCDCDCDTDGHDEGCSPCLPCRIGVEL